MTGLGEVLVEAGEQAVHRAGLGEMLAEQPDRLGVRHPVAEPQPEEAHELADATNTHTFWDLIRIGRWHVEGEAYDRALAMVVEAQAALPMAQFWRGHLASSDGQFFAATEQGEAMNLVNAKYGNTTGLKAYSHVSTNMRRSRPR